jgi:hypothetical protein
VEFRIRADIDGALRDLEQLAERVRDQALTRSINRTLVGVRTAVSRETRSVLNLRARDVEKVLSVRRARAGEPVGEVVVAAKAAPLIAFGARQTTRGVSVKVRRQGSRTVLRRSFIATMRSGHRGVFQRRERRRLPIGELFSTAPAQLLDQTPSIIERIGEQARERFEREIARELRRFTS